ncbi:MAG: hypothetical protein H6814_04290 [Phycisphaeraceae bacterium]|nr:hypothetical protein [Phycisphaeraceae bacterium]
MIQTLATTAGQHATATPVSLPWGAEAIAAAGLIAGILLWLWGRKLVKPLYALAFGVGAGLIGFTGPATLGVNVDPNILMVALGIFGVIVGLIVFRITMGLTLGVVLGFAVATGAVLAIGAQADAVKAAQTAPVPSEESIYLDGAEIVENLGTEEVQRRLDAMTESLVSGDTSDSRSIDIAEPSDAERIARSAAKEVRAFMLELFDEAGAWWDTVPIRLRVAGLGGWLMGFALGLLLGLARPTPVAGFASAFVGAAIWIPCGAYLAHWIRIPGHELLPTSAGAWASAWIVIACIGAAIQWTKRKPSADLKDEEE